MDVPKCNLTCPYKRERGDLAHEQGAVLLALEPEEEALRKELKDAAWELDRMRGLVTGFSRLQPC